MCRQISFTRRAFAAFSTVLIALFAFASAVSAQTAAFTYQGRLTDSSMTANGSYDLEFKLYDQSGAQIGAAQVKEAVPVTNGTFTVRLDFGAAAFDGAERTLEIAVRRGNESGAFTALTPRQPITSTPYAVRASSASNADNATNADNAQTAATATNAEQLGGVAAANYLQTNGSGASLTDLNASSVTTGTLPDAALSANVARRNQANTFTGDQTVNGNLAQTGTTTDLNLTSGLVARGEVGTGVIPATGAGSRMMFYPGKAAFRAGRVFDDVSFGGFNNNGSRFWDDANIGAGSVAFGSNNRAGGADSAAFGRNADASGERSFALNGTATASGAVAIGSGAQATGEDTLALGPSSQASGLVAIAIGPSRAIGNYPVAIGLQNQARGQFSVAIGKNASDCSAFGCSGMQANPNVVYNGVVSISDACAQFSSDNVTATANNQVNIRGCGGFRFFTGRNTGGGGSSNPPPISGVELAPGGSQWLSLSDRNSKENFQPVNSRDILRKVLNLPISTWNYKSQAASIRHIGAMAQDFKAAFAVGEDDRHISALDPDGVALAAIQGLNEEMRSNNQKLQTENARLRLEIKAQGERLAAIEARFKEADTRTARRGRKPRASAKRK